MTRTKVSLALLVALVCLAGCGPTFDANLWEVRNPNPFDVEVTPLSREGLLGLRTLASSSPRKNIPIRAGASVSVLLETGDFNLDVVVVTADGMRPRAFDVGNTPWVVDPPLYASLREASSEEVEATEPPYALLVGFLGVCALLCIVLGFRARQKKQSK